MKKSVNPRDSELRKIVLSAGSKNRAAGITGGLMFNRSYFGQVLEGEREAVSQLFLSYVLDVVTEDEGLISVAVPTFDG